MTAEETAELQRDIGPIYNLLILYTAHNGPLRRLTSNLTRLLAAPSEWQSQSTT